jgi:hypothetical protein
VADDRLWNFPYWKLLLFNVPAAGYQEGEKAAMGRILGHPRFQPAKVLKILHSWIPHGTEAIDLQLLENADNTLFHRE